MNNSETEEVSNEQRKELISELFYMLAVGCWLLAVGCWLLAVGWVVVTYFAQPFLKFINPFLLLAIGGCLSTLMFILRTKIALPYIKQPLSKRFILFFIATFSILLLLSAIEGV